MRNELYCQNATDSAGKSVTVELIAPRSIWGSCSFLCFFNYRERIGAVEVQLHQPLPDGIGGFGGRGDSGGGLPPTT